MIPPDDLPGAVFRWDPQRKGNDHRWIILTEGDSDGLCLTACLTDANKYLPNPFIWTEGTAAGDSYRLIKDSVLRADHTRLENHEKIQIEGEYCGHIGMDAVAKARHEICQMRLFVKRTPRDYLEALRFLWCSECRYADDPVQPNIE